jgi:hypothetical protein
MKKQPKSWLVFSSLAFQIGIVMYLMVSLGEWVREKWEIISNWPTLVASFTGLVVVVYMINKQGKRD